MSLINDIRAAVKAGRIPKQFTARDCRNANLGWVDKTYSTFLPKHRVGNPEKNTHLFRQVRRGVYELYP